MKIVVLDGYTLNPGDLSWDPLEKFGTYTIYDRTSYDDEQEIMKRIGEAQVVLTNKVPLSEKVIQNCGNLIYIGILATGYNIIDLKAASHKKIVVSNVPSYGTEAVGQFAIGLLLEICHHIGYHDFAVHQGRWTNCQDWCFWDWPLIELAGKTMGIIGFGRIGQATGRISRALGMKVIAYDKAENKSGKEIGEYVTLDALFRTSDVISLHCPLLPDTKEIINRRTIQLMKNGVIILNNSRGALINEEDLASALNTEKVYAAGLDVVSSEPIKSDNPLLKAKNCIITPHISWGPLECRKRLMNVVFQNLEAFVQGKPINVVNELN